MIVEPDVFKEGPRRFRAWLEAEKAKGTKSVSYFVDGEDCGPLGRYAEVVLGPKSIIEMGRETWWYGIWDGDDPEEFALPLWAAEYMAVFFDWLDGYDQDGRPPKVAPWRALRFLTKALGSSSVRAEQQRLANLEPLLPLSLPREERPWRVPV